MSFLFSSIDPHPLFTDHHRIIFKDNHPNRLKITITTTLESSIEKQGSAAIPLQPLLDIAGELPDDTRVEMEANDKNIKINTNFGTYDLMGKDPEEYPAAPDTMPNATR